MTQTTVVNDLIRLRNTSDKEWRHRYLHMEVILPPNSDTVIGRDVMIYLMGNPELRDIDHRRKPRTQEVKRIRLLYGAAYDDELWELNKPPLQAFTVEGERIHTIMDDPEGKHGLPQTLITDQQTLMQKQIDALQAQLRDIQNSQVMADRTAQAEQYDLTVDDPSPSPSTVSGGGAYDGLVPVGHQETTLPSAAQPEPPIDPGDAPVDMPRRIEVS